MRAIGIRELRQRASEWLRRVESGETIEVHNRGRPVALLVPIPKGSERDRLVAEGRIRPASGNLRDVRPLPAVKDGPTLSEILEGMRSDEH